MITYHLARRAEIGTLLWRSKYKPGGSLDKADWYNYANRLKSIGPHANAVSVLHGLLSGHASCESERLLLGSVDQEAYQRERIIRMPAECCCIGIFRITFQVG